MSNKKEYKAICIETNKEIMYGKLTIKNAVGNKIEQPSCSYSEKCSKVDCICKDGTTKYKIKEL